MLTQFKLLMAAGRHWSRAVFIAALLSGVAGCTSVGSVLDSRIDYKSAAKAPTLEIPPDLTQLQRDNRYAVPAANSTGVATASGFNAQQGVKPEIATVAASITAEGRVERAGNQRWLVVKQTPEQLWPQIKDFWQESGFLINIDMPEAGVMETDWAENRAKIPQDLVRSAIGGLLGSLYSTSERDKFRTRVERGANGNTEIYVSHRGAQEVLSGVRNEQTQWVPRPSDPELEAEFLSRLLVRLGVEKTRAQASVANAVSQPARAKLATNAGATYLEVDEGFDRAWRRVGLALDRVGFTVEDRDRSQGTYFVRYVDQGQDAQNKQAGFFSRILSFGSSSEQAKSAQRYRITVKGSGEQSQVAVLDKDGNSDRSSAAGKILALLNEQLK